MAHLGERALGGVGLVGVGLVLRALGRRSKEGVTQASGGLTGAFTIEGVRRQVGGREISAIGLATGTFSSVTPRFNGTVINRGNVPFEGQVSLTMTSDGFPVDVRVQNVNVAPGAGGAVVSISATVPQSAPPGDIVAEARLVDLNGALKGRLLSGVLGRVEAVVDVTFEGGFGV